MLERSVNLLADDSIFIEFARRHAATMRTVKSVAEKAGITEAEATVAMQEWFKPAKVETVERLNDSKSLQQSIGSLLEAKRFANRSAIYIKSLQNYLTHFAKGREAIPLAAVKTEHIESWIGRFAGQWSRHTWLNRINTLFSFAKRRGFVRENPCDRIDRICVDGKSPIIFTVEQSRAILAGCPLSLRPFLILAMYAGIRPDGELLKMDWADISLETGTVRVNHPKVRKHRRIVKLEPIAIELLTANPTKTGPVSPSKATVKRWHVKARAILGRDRWPHDVLRHTAASYLIALYGDVGKVSTMLGNSPRILLSHYHEPVTKEACEQFWKLP